jgi:hypothetical protein
MKTKLLAVLMIGSIAFFSCTNAPESDEAKTTEAKKVDNSKSGDVWKLNISDSKVEWVATKVSGYHVGNVPLKSGEINVKNGEVTGGKFILDLANMQVVGPKGSDTAMNKKLLRSFEVSRFF